MIDIGHTLVETPIFHSVIWYLAKCVLRSPPNLHYRKGQFLASPFEYNDDRYRMS